VALPERGRVLEIGQARVLREGERVALIALGSRLADARAASEMLAARGISVTLVDARFAKPFDAELIEQLARHHELVVTIEEGSQGGFGAAVLQHLAGRGLLDGATRFRSLALPDHPIEHDTPAKQIIAAGLDANAISQTVENALGQNRLRALG
jgi:1-deoxy-D-xylulose-5-phosphate synthase